MDISVPTCLITARMDEKSQAFFDEIKSRYFSAERNLPSAHFTPFQKLPDTEQNQRILTGLVQQPLECWVTVLKNIGHVVAYFIDSNERSNLHGYLRQQFLSVLSARTCKA